MVLKVRITCSSHKTPGGQFGSSISYTVWAESQKINTYMTKLQQSYILLNALEIILQING